MARSNGLVDRLVRVTLLSLAAIVLVASCGGSRPTVDEWLPRWEQIVTGIPTEAELGPAPSGDTCSRALGFLRTNSEDLVPTPDLAIDDTVRTWIEVAEDTFFGCPPATGDIEGFGEAYRELRSLELEVEAVLNTL